MNHVVTLLLILLIVCAVAVSFTKSLLNSVVIFSAFSFIMAIIWFILESPDLAITEAAVGAGVDTILFFVTLKKIKQMKAKDDERKEPLSKKTKTVRALYIICCIVFCFVIARALLYTVSCLPQYGNPDNPANNEVSEKYIEDGLDDTGAVNIVAGMILDYRAFDTYGESNVLFIACCCVLILLRNDQKKKNEDEIMEPFEKNPILASITAVLFPIILLFGIYIILNGHLSPGGGFSGGAIIGAGLILYANAYGFDKLENFFTAKTFQMVVFVALLFYGLAKSYSFFTGANHMESHIPKGTPGAIISSGLILPLNICVGIVVACTMYGFYSVFKRGGLSDDTKIDR